MGRSARNPCWTWQEVRSGPKTQTNNGEQDNAGEPTNFSNSSVSNRGIKEQSKINCLADAHLLALKASTLRMMRWSEKISHSAFMSAISAGLTSLALMARAMLV